MRPTLALAALFALLLAAHRAAANGGSIQSIIDAERHPNLNRADFGAYVLEVREAYEANGYRPLWLEDGHPTTQANELIDALLAASDSGLLPADYDAGWLDAERIRLNTAPEDSAAFDTGLTVSTMRYISDAYRGRVNPRDAGFDLEFQPKPLDFSSIVGGLAHAAKPGEQLAAFEPPFRVYAGLKAALQRLRTLAAGSPLPEIPTMPASLHPGESDAGVAAVRAYLTLLGYLDGVLVVPENGDVYDPALAEAVKRFQQRYGLEADGVLGRQTLRQMQVPLTDRVKQIELAMERLRWLPYQFTQRFVLVNLPEYRLRGFVERDAPPAVSTNVVVGSAASKTETPVLYADMRYVIFRPYWNVPWSITTKELLPSLRRDPHYLAKHDYEIVIGHGNETQVLSPTAENIALVGGTARLRQKPGDDNALGLIKFIFPNPSNVYLHDTPSKSLFRRSRRDFSHGCIRVADPVSLARFVLGEDEWSEARVLEAMQRGRDNARATLPEPVRVLLYYTTAVVEEDGEVYFFDDIYGHDLKLAKLLAKG